MKTPLNLLLVWCWLHQVISVVVPVARGQDSQFSSSVPFTGSTCRAVTTMLRSKRWLSGNLLKLMNSSRPDPITEKEQSEKKRALHTKMLQLFRRELDQNEEGVFKALNGMARVLAADYWVLSSIKENSKWRMEGLKAASLLEEENYNEIVELEKSKKSLSDHSMEGKQKNGTSNLNQAERLVKSLLSNVEQAADNLEEGINKEKVFEKSIAKQGAKLETVVKLEEDEDRKEKDKDSNSDGKAQNKDLDQDESKPADRRSSNNDEGSKKHEAAMSMLIDSQNNVYVLAKPAESTVTHQDLNLLRSMSTTLMLAFVLGAVCRMLGLPAFFGYVLGGIIIGPAYLNRIKSQVQMETLGEFGVYLLLFGVGVEFSPDKLRHVWGLALSGSLCIALAMQLVCLVAGSILHILPQQSCFVAACLTLSSTPLAERLFRGSTLRRGVWRSRTESDSELLSPSLSGASGGQKGTSCLPCGPRCLLSGSSVDGTSTGGKGLNDIARSMLDMLVMQDVYLALFVALLPTLADQVVTSSSTPLAAPTQAGISSSSDFASPGLLSGVAWLAVQCVFFGLFAWLCSFTLVPLFFRFLTWMKEETNHANEVYTLGIISILLGCVSLTHHFSISNELGCLLAGVLVSSQGQSLSVQVQGAIEAVRHVFTAIFFVTVGFHVFPQFIMMELTVVLTLTAAVIYLKYLITVVILRTVLPLSQRWAVSLAAAGIAQVSEYAFLVGSRGRRLGLISREVYLLMLSVTAASQFLAPLLWHLSLWRQRAHLCTCAAEAVPCGLDKLSTMLSSAMCAACTFPRRLLAGRGNSS